MPKASLKRQAGRRCDSLLSKASSSKTSKRFIACVSSTYNSEPPSSITSALLLPNVVWRSASHRRSSTRPCPQLSRLRQARSRREAHIKEADARVKLLMTRSELCQRIGQIEVIGPLTATAVVVAVGDAKQFKNGRHLAAWLGLVPR